MALSLLSSIGNEGLHLGTSRRVVIGKPACTSWATVEDLCESGSSTLQRRFDSEFPGLEFKFESYLKKSVQSWVSPIMQQKLGKY